MCKQLDVLALQSLLRPHHYPKSRRDLQRYFERRGNPRVLQARSERIVLWGKRDHFLHGPPRVLGPNHLASVLEQQPVCVDGALNGGDAISRYSGQIINCFPSPYTQTRGRRAQGVIPRLHAQQAVAARLEAEGGVLRLGAHEGITVEFVAQGLIERAVLLAGEALPFDFGMERVSGFSDLDGTGVSCGAKVGLSRVKEDQRVDGRHQWRTLDRRVQQVRVSGVAEQGAAPRAVVGLTASLILETAKDHKMQLCLEEGGFHCLHLVVAALAARGTIPGGKGVVKQAKAISIHHLRGPVYLSSCGRCSGSEQGSWGRQERQKKHRSRPAGLMGREDECGVI
ncbi:hypothetical protein BDK51DRAFT_25524 [Blyttiomyces helicus]|uniref:Uncharacterized protein n=1 Tax=Blyttiomyces helicus TaxID=388810 RepID=A0A4P9WF53_9FUNG|nr:hypothetical protein BDK51DRAFT_25524 [Blyttiomyces helicus]|eukprot:RKO89640.1 hypothetical protein BDK51DRAFT_25524 [Blyttiomyces helicus]